MIDISDGLTSEILHLSKHSVLESQFMKINANRLHDHESVKRS